MADQLQQEVDLIADHPSGGAKESCAAVKDAWLYLKDRLWINQPDCA
jgi:hypothetical protein